MRTETLVTTTATIPVATEVVDLDSTDELPQLDIEAYEASLAENQKGLARTDAWSIEALNDIEELSEAQRQMPRVPARAAVSSEAVTVNVDRILKRIAEVEAGIVAAQDANAVLQKRGEEIQADRDQQAQQLRTLEADNTRLREHRELADEMAQRVEHQLRQQLQQAAMEMAELQTAHAEAAAALEKSLVEERTSNAQLARQLAAKLKDFEMATTLIEARNRTIEELTRERDAMIAEKDRQLAELTSDLDRAGMDLAAARQQHETATSEFSALDASHSKSLSELAQLRAQIDDLRASLQSAEHREAEVQQELATALLAAKEGRQSRAEIEKHLKEAQGQVGSLTEARDTAEARVRALSEQLEALAPASNQIESLKSGLDARDQVVGELTAQLQTTNDERAAMSTQLDKSRARVKSLTQQIFSRDNQIAALQADLAVYTEALAAIRRDVSRIGDGTGPEPGEEIERVLEPLDPNGTPIFLTGEMFSVGRTSENDIVIPSKLISRHHARLLVGPTGVIVEDAGSTNGCYVNGEQVRQHLLRDGDVLELGEVRYRLSVRSRLDTRTRPNVIPITESRRAEE